MSLKLIPRLKPDYNIREILAACNIFKPAISQFEEDFAKKFECSYGTMFSYGRSGIYTLFKVWNLSEAEVICPAYTCVVVQHAIVLSGNKPVFIDCADRSFNMDCDEIERKIGLRTRAIVVTHLFGNPMDVKRIDKIAQQAEKKYGHKIYVIQDTAHSFGARWQGDLVTKYGDAAIFGLNISKIANSIFGGMVITRSGELDTKLKAFRNEHMTKSKLKPFGRMFYLLAVCIAFNPYIYRLVNWLERGGWLNRFVKYYDEAKIQFPEDWDTWPTDLEARVGLVQLSKYDDIVRARKSNSLAWINKLGDDEIEFLTMNEGCTYSHCVGLVQDRDKWIEEYSKKGVQLGILIEYSVPEMKAYEQFATEEADKAGNHKKRTINFPVWRGIKTDQTYG